MISDLFSIYFQSELKINRNITDYHVITFL